MNHHKVNVPDGTDDQFCQDLASNPKATLERNGFTATDEVMTTITGMNAAALLELAIIYRADSRMLGI